MAEENKPVGDADATRSNGPPKQINPRAQPSNPTNPQSNPPSSSAPSSNTNNRPYVPHIPFNNLYGSRINHPPARNPNQPNLERPATPQINRNMNATSQNRPSRGPTHAVQSSSQAEANDATQTIDPARPTSSSSSDKSSMSQRAIKKAKSVARAHGEQEDVDSSGLKPLRHGMSRKEYKKFNSEVREHMTKREKKRFDEDGESTQAIISAWREDERKRKEAAEAEDLYNNHMSEEERRMFDAGDESREVAIATARERKKEAAIAAWRDAKSKEAAEPEVLYNNEMSEEDLSLFDAGNRSGEAAIAAAHEREEASTLNSDASRVSSAPHVSSSSAPMTAKDEMREFYRREREEHPNMEHIPASQRKYAGRWVNIKKRMKAAKKKTLQGTQAAARTSKDDTSSRSASPVSDDNAINQSKDQKAITVTHAYQVASGAKPIGKPPTTKPEDPRENELRGIFSKGQDGQEAVERVEELYNAKDMPEEDDSWQMENEFTGADIQMSNSPPIKTDKTGGKWGTYESPSKTNQRIDRIKQQEVEAVPEVSHDQPEVLSVVDANAMARGVGGQIPTPRGHKKAGSNSKIQDIRLSEENSRTRRADSTAKLSAIRLRNRERSQFFRLSEGQQPAEKQREEQQPEAQQPAEAQSAEKQSGHQQPEDLFSTSPDVVEPRAESPAHQEQEQQPFEDQQGHDNPVEEDDQILDATTASSDTRSKGKAPMVDAEVLPQPLPDDGNVDEINDSQHGSPARSKGDHPIIRPRPGSRRASLSSSKSARNIEDIAASADQMDDPPFGLLSPSHTASRRNSHSSNKPKAIEEHEVGGEDESMQIIDDMPWLQSEPWKLEPTIPTGSQSAYPSNPLESRTTVFDNSQKSQLNVGSLKSLRRATYYGDSISKRSSMAQSDISDPVDRIEAEMRLFAPLDAGSERGSMRAPSPMPDEDDDEAASNEPKETPRPVKIDPLAMPTPKVTGAFVDTPTSTNLLTSSRMKSASSVNLTSSLRNHREQRSGSSMRRARSLSRQRSPLINSAKPASARDDLREVQRLNEIEDSTTVDVTLEKLDELLAAQPPSFSDEEETKTESPTKKKKTETVDDLAALNRMTKQLTTGLLGIQTAKKGIERLESSVSHPEKSVGREAERIKKDTCPSPAIEPTSSSHVVWISVPVPRVWHSRPRTRPSWFGYLLLILCFLCGMEKATCDRFCKPRVCYPGETCIWSPDDPTFGNAMLVKADEVLTNGRGRVLVNHVLQECSDVAADIWDTLTGLDISKLTATHYQVMNLRQRRQHRRRLVKKGLMKPWIAPPAMQPLFDAWSNAREGLDRAAEARDLYGLDLAPEERMNNDMEDSFTARAHAEETGTYSDPDPDVHTHTADQPSSVRRVWDWW